MDRAQLTATIEGPVIMPALARYTALDGIIAFAAVERMKAWNPEYSLEDVFICIGNLPFRKVQVGNEYFNLCSFIEVEKQYPLDLFSQGIDVADNTIFKSSNVNAVGPYWGIDVAIEACSKLLGFQKGGGPFKSAMIELSPVYITKVSWIFEGDVEKVKDLFSDITYLGKKPAIGQGFIKGFEITTVPSDTPIRRTVPLGLSKKPLSEPHYPARLIPPYWKSTDKHWCGIGEA